MPFLTVTIPTKDRPLLLPRAVRSVLDQVDDVEVIVVDDGSTPENAQTISTFCRSDRRIRLLRNEVSGGSPHGRNQGLKAARGRYWATLDDDDMWLPGKWAEQFRILTVNDFPPDLIVVSAIRSSPPRPDVTDNMLLMGDEAKRLERLYDVLQTIAVFLNSFVAPTELMRAVGGFDERLVWGEYTDLLVRLWPVARFAGTKQVGVFVERDHQYSATRTGENWHRKAEGITLLLGKHREHFRRDARALGTYRHVLGISHLRAGRRWAAAAALGAAAGTGPDIGARARALGHLGIAVIGGPGLWAAVEGRRSRVKTGHGPKPS